MSGIENGNENLAKMKRLKMRSWRRKWNWNPKEKESWKAKRSACRGEEAENSYLKATANGESGWENILEAKLALKSEIPAIEEEKISREENSSIWLLFEENSILLQKYKLKYRRNSASRSRKPLAWRRRKCSASLADILKTTVIQRKL